MAKMPPTRNVDTFSITKRVVVGRVEFSEYGDKSPILAALEVIAKDASEHTTDEGLEYSTYQFPLPGTEQTFSVSISSEIEEDH